MIGTVFVESLATQCHIGCTEAERLTAQAIFIDVSCEVEMQQAVTSDERSNCVDYCELQRLALERANATSYSLLETLASDIALRVNQLPHVKATTVRIRKPHKLPGSTAVGISLTIQRQLEKRGDT